MVVAITESRCRDCSLMFVSNASYCEWMAKRGRKEATHELPFHSSWANFHGGSVLRAHEDITGESITVHLLSGAM